MCDMCLRTHLLLQHVSDEFLHLRLFLLCQNSSVLMYQSMILTRRWHHALMKCTPLGFEGICITRLVLRLLWLVKVQPERFLQLYTTAVEVQQEQTAHSEHASRCFKQHVVCFRIKYKHDQGSNSKFLSAESTETNFLSCHS